MVTVFSALADKRARRMPSYFAPTIVYTDLYRSNLCHGLQDTIHNDINNSEMVPGRLHLTSKVLKLGEIITILLYTRLHLDVYEFLMAE